jgi:hypothetical protein
MVWDKPCRCPFDSVTPAVTEHRCPSQRALHATVCEQDEPESDLELYPVCCYTWRCVSSGCVQ